MTFRVVITPEAEADLKQAYRYIRGNSPAAARRWITGARKAIKTLARNPERCPLAPESVAFQQSIREQFYGRGNRGTYRILFVILPPTVFVLQVRHGSMDKLKPID